MKLLLLTKMASKCQQKIQKLQTSVSRPFLLDDYCRFLHTFYPQQMTTHYIILHHIKHQFTPHTASQNDIKWFPTVFSPTQKKCSKTPPTRPTNTIYIEIHQHILNNLHCYYLKSPLFLKNGLLPTRRCAIF